MTVKSVTCQHSGDTTVWQSREDVTSGSRCSWAQTPVLPLRGGITLSNRLLVKATVLSLASRDGEHVACSPGFGGGAPSDAQCSGSAGFCVLPAFNDHLVVPPPIPGQD